MNFKDIVDLLLEKNKKVSTMESCTGGMLANMITNVEGSSSVFAYGAVTYSNAFKINMGVSASVIDTYTVYSVETARSMAKAVADFALSDYGIGITGRLNCEDTCNMGGSHTMVYFSIYDRETDTYQDQSLSITGEAREEMKQNVIRLLHLRFLEKLSK